MGTRGCELYYMPRNSREPVTCTKRLHMGKGDLEPLITKEDADCFFKADWESWFLSNLKARKEDLGGDRPATFAIICWLIWKWRNLHMHDTNFMVPQNTGEIVKRHLRQFYGKWGPEEDECQDQGVVWVRWMPPPQGGSN